MDSSLPDQIPLLQASGLPGARPFPLPYDLVPVVPYYRKPRGQACLGPVDCADIFVKFVLWAAPLHPASGWLLYNQTVPMPKN